MEDPVGPLGWLLLSSFILGQAVAWLLFRRRLRQMSKRLQALAEYRAAEQERQSDSRYDGLLQDIMGLALSLQAVAEQLPRDGAARQKLERVLSRMDQLSGDARQLSAASSAVPREQG